MCSYLWCASYNTFQWVLVLRVDVFGLDLGLGNFVLEFPRRFTKEGVHQCWVRYFCMYL